MCHCACLHVFAAFQPVFRVVQLNFNCWKTTVERSCGCIHSVILLNDSKSLPWVLSGTALSLVCLCRTVEYML